MKKITYILLAFTISGCQRGCNRIEKEFEYKERKYEIYLYSGGEIVFYDKFTGIVNDSKNSDGVYYFNENGYLVEISGDYVIKSR